MSINIVIAVMAVLDIVVGAVTLHGARSSSYRDTTTEGTVVGIAFIVIGIALLIMVVLHSLPF